MEKNLKTKSILVCTVLASVLAGWMVPAFARTANARNLNDVIRVIQNGWYDTVVLPVAKCYFDGELGSVRRLLPDVPRYLEIVQKEGVYDGAFCGNGQGSGIHVNQGDTLTIRNLGYIGGWKDWFIYSDGTVNIYSDKGYSNTLDSTIRNFKDINVRGTLILGSKAKIEGRCDVQSDSVLEVLDNGSFIDDLRIAGVCTWIVDGNKIQDKAAIICASVDCDIHKIKLIIKNQKEGMEYKIIERAPKLMLMTSRPGNANTTPDLEEIVWPEYGLVVDLNNSQFGDSCSVTLKKDPELPEYSDIPNIVTGLINQKESVPWIQELTNKFQTYPDKDLYLEALNNSANTLANLNSLANVQGGLRTMSSLITDSIQENAGLRGKDSGLRIEEQGARENVWASYIHSKEKIEGRKTGHLKQNSTLQYNGVVVGADLWKSEHGFGGVALSYADGNFHSSQLVTGVRNEADYYGISVYNRQDVGKFSFIYNGGFTYGKNDATLINYWDENITAKPKAMAYNMGFKMEEPIKLSKATELTPFAGLRYTFIKTKDYTDNCADGYSADNQHLVNLPIGLTLKGTYETKEGWNLGGSLTGGYNWNLGNRRGTQSIEYGGFSDSMNFDMADRGEYFVKAGLTAEYKNLAFELGYRYSKGDTSRDNRWNVNMNWSF